MVKKVILIKNLRYKKPVYPYDVKVDRSSPLGNPFYMADESERDEVCDKYDVYLQKEMCCYSQDKFATEIHKLKDIWQKYGKLNLFCWCSPKRCHAKTIKSYLEAIV